MSNITVSQRNKIKRLSLNPVMALIVVIIMSVIFSLTGCDENEIPAQIKKVGTVTENGVTYDLMRYPNPDGTFSTYKVHPGPYYANEEMEKFQKENGL